MRDPARIVEIVELLSEVWRHEPDLSLGQLVFIAARMNSSNIDDIYSIEDDDLKKGLILYFELVKNRAVNDDIE